MDCIYLKCTAVGRRKLGHGPSCSPAGRQLADHERQLGHGGAATLSAPAGWLPDPTAPSTDFCDMRTMITNATTASTPMAGFFWYTGWYITCLLLPRTLAPYSYIVESGLQAIVMMIAEGIDPIAARGFVPIMYQSNPIPALPYLHGFEGPCLVSGCLSRGATSDYPSWSIRSKDNVSLLTLIQFPLACSTSPCSNLSASTCQGSVQKVMATLVPENDGEDLSGPGAQFLYVVVGLGFVAQIIFVFVTLAKRKKSYTCLHTFVMIAEGVVCGGLRAYRQFENPTFGGATGNVSSGEGMWLLDANASLEGSLSLSTTLMTLAVYIKVVLSAMGFRLSKRVDRSVDAVVGLVAILLFGVLAFFSLIYPFQPWLKSEWEFVNGIGNAKLKEISGEPPFIINIFLLCAFVVVTFFALYLLIMKAKMAQSSSIMTTVKRLFKYIALQVVGMIFVVVSLKLRADYTTKLYYSWAPYAGYWMQFQFQAFGTNLLKKRGYLLQLRQVDRMMLDVFVFLWPSVPQQRLFSLAIRTMQV